MVNAIISLLSLYGGLATIFLLHALAIAPQKIILSFKNGLPVFTKEEAVNPNTSIIIDALIILVAYLVKPESLFLQATSLMAWTHLILNTLLKPLLRKKELKNSYYLKTVIIILLGLVTGTYFVSIGTTIITAIL